MAALTADSSLPGRPTGGAPGKLTCPPEDLDGNALLPDLGLPVAAGPGLLIYCVFNTGSSAPATQTPLSGTTGPRQGGDQQTNPAAGAGGATNGQITHVFTTTITADGSETTGIASAAVYKDPATSIVGVVLGALALIAVLVWLLRRRRANVRRKREEQDEWGNVFKDHTDWLGREQRALMEDRDKE